MTPTRMSTLIFVALLTIVASPSWAALTFCDTFGADNTCIETIIPPPGTETADNVLAAINAHLRPGWVPLTQLVAPDGQLVALVDNDPNNPGLSGTWEFSKTVNFVVAKSSLEFKVFEFMDGATTGMWDTVGINNPTDNSQQQLSHVSFWAFSPADPPTAVPLPAASLLFGSGLLGLLGFAARKGRPMN